LEKNPEVMAMLWMELVKERVDPDEECREDRVKQVAKW
jgi:hypothetical protein